MMFSIHFSNTSALLIVAINILLSVHICEASGVKSNIISDFIETKSENSQETSDKIRQFTDFLVRKFKNKSKFAQVDRFDPAKFAANMLGSVLCVRLYNAEVGRRAKNLSDFKLSVIKRIKVTAVNDGEKGWGYTYSAAKKENHICGAYFLPFGKTELEAKIAAVYYAAIEAFLQSAEFQKALLLTDSVVEDRNNRIDYPEVINAAINEFIDIVNDRMAALKSEDEIAIFKISSSSWAEVKDSGDLSKERAAIVSAQQAVSPLSEALSLDQIQVTFEEKFSTTLSPEIKKCFREKMKFDHR